MTEGRGTPKARGDSQGLASWAIGGVAAVAVVAGLAVAGGPLQARKEQRDAARSNDLSSLERHISCLVRDSGRRELPVDIGATPGCPGPVPLTDTHSGEDYRIETIDAEKYRICADFEVPQDDPPPSWEIDRRDGNCMIYSLPVLHPTPAEVGSPDPLESGSDRPAETLPQD